MPHERAATYCLFIIAALGPAINFLIPLYIQIVQGYNSLETAVAVIPYSLAIFAAAALVVRLFDRWSPRQIGRISFIVVAIGLVMLAFTIWNEWTTPLVILSLIVIEEYVYIDNIDFVSNEQLDEALEETDLTPMQEAEVVEINGFARLQSLKISFLFLACITLLAIILAGGLPNDVPKEVPAEIAPEIRGTIEPMAASF